MTRDFKRCHLEDVTIPLVFILGILLVLFCILLPNSLLFVYALTLLVVIPYLHYRSFRAAHLTDFTYTVKYNDEYLQIALPGDKVATYRRATLTAKDMGDHFLLSDGATSTSYWYTNSFFKFLDALDDDYKSKNSKT